MTEKNSIRPQSNIIIREPYRYTLKLTRASFAWEFLRRNSVYRYAYSRSLQTGRDIVSKRFTHVRRLLAWDRTAEQFGLWSFRRPRKIGLDRSTLLARARLRKRPADPGKAAQSPAILEHAFAREGEGGEACLDHAGRQEAHQFVWCGRRLPAVPKR